jgi:hypothetical protein
MSRRMLLLSVLLLGIQSAFGADASGPEGLELGCWRRIGPFRNMKLQLNWMDHIPASFACEFDVEKDVMSRHGAARLDRSYPAPNFPATPKAVRKWTKHNDWIDGYYQELPRGPAPSAGECQYLYRTITAKKEMEIELDFILRAPESDRRDGARGMEDWRRTGRYWWSLNGKKMVTWNGRHDMPRAERGRVRLKAGVNHFLAKVINNRHSYGFAFSIKGLHPKLRHEVGFEQMWRSHILDLQVELPYHTVGVLANQRFTDEKTYAEGLKRLRALRFHPQAMPGVESAARDSKGRVVPAMEAALEKYPTSPAGDRHAVRLARLEKFVTPLLNKIDKTGKPHKAELLAAVSMLEKMWIDTIRELPPLIYLERETYEYDSMMFEMAGRENSVIKSFDPATKKVRTIADLGKEKSRIRANEINLSWDAKTIYIGGDGGVWAIGSDGSEPRRLTSGQSPSEMPDGRIVFFDGDVGQAPCKGGDRRRMLFICDPDGKNRKLVSANNTIDTTPTVMNDGRIIFTRWDYGVNKNVFNRHALWTQNPDGSAIDLYFGNTIIDPRSFCRPRQVPGRPEILVIFGPHHARLSGLMGLVWNGAGREARDGLGFRRITHDSASVGDRPEVWSYQDPYPLNEQLFLVSFGGRYGKNTALYLYDRSGNRKCVLDTGSSKGVHSAQPFVARKKPPVIPDRSISPNWTERVDLHQRLMDDPDWKQKGTLMLQDVYLGLEPEIKRGDIKYIAVMEQPTQSHARGGAIGVGTIWYVNRFLGLVPVEADGSAHFEAPALRSLFFHVLDKDGRMLMTQGSDFHVMPGEKRSCIGCHEQRKGISASSNRGRLSIAMKKPAVRPKLPDWGTRGVIEYETVVQPVLDKYCVKCHNGEKPKGKLNLTGDLTTAYNMSYMQLTDGCYVHFTPGTGATHSQPSNDSDHQAPLSRGSVLSKLTKYVQDPKHSKKKIPFEDQLKIFLWIDSNVPFFSHYRQIPRARLTQGARGRLADVHQRRCVSCHKSAHDKFMPDEKSGLSEHHIRWHIGELAGQWGIANSGMRVRHLNLSNPSHSAALLAPLSVKAGGWGLCKGAGAERLFNDKNDPDYKAILSSLKTGVRKLDKNDIQGKGIKQLLKERQAAEKK